jgi:energy-coupling factor transport system ATP-binding protein
MNDPFIQVSGVEYAYPDGTKALSGIDLEIGQGDFVAFIGQNGSGKTTLSKCLNGLYKPTAGKILVDGLDTRSTRIVEMVKRVGYVFQNPDHQLFNATCWSEIAYGPRNIGLNEEEVRVRVAEAASVVGLPEEEFEQHPFFLTKGMRQRVAIAAILALRPRAIIVDEPTTGQDLKQSVEIMDFLQGLQKQQDEHIIIIVTHDMPIVARYAKRVVAMGRGRILADGPTSDVFANVEALAQTFVEPPQITQLAQRVTHLGFDPRSATVEELVDQYLRLVREPGGEDSSTAS